MEPKLRKFLGDVRNTRDTLEAEARRMRKARGKDPNYYMGGLTTIRYAIDLLNCDLKPVARMKS